MRVAVASDDLRTVGSHFGRAGGYVVLTMEHGEVVGREIRRKPGGGRAAMQRASRSPSEVSSDLDWLDSQLEPISDCDVVVAGEMGENLFTEIQNRGLQPLVGAVGPIEDIVRDYLAETLGVERWPPSSFVSDLMGAARVPTPRRNGEAHVPRADRRPIDVRRPRSRERAPRRRNSSSPGRHGR